MLCHPCAEDWITSPQIPSRLREVRQIAANIAKLPDITSMIASPFSRQCGHSVVSPNEFSSTKQVVSLASTNKSFNLTFPTFHFAKKGRQVRPKKNRGCSLQCFNLFCSMHRLSALSNRRRRLHSQSLPGHGSNPHKRWPHTRPKLIN